MQRESEAEGLQSSSSEMHVGDHFVAGKDEQRRTHSPEAVMTRTLVQISWPAHSPVAKALRGRRRRQMAPPLPRAPPRALLMGLWLLLLQGHARLMDPPARNSMWRLGFPNPVDYDDNELYCGGWSVQHQQNGGRCGVCGDPWNQREPRAHEAGGKFAKGIIGRRYTVGQDITIEVDLTSNHYGYFEAKICPNNNPRYEATQECFDRYPLYVSGTRDVAMQIPPDTPKKAYLPYRVRLPPYLTCTQCVIQWTYYT
ncbi:Uncharacterized protein GBIM_05171, partial [Gryllus bimaculatus]